MNMRSMALGGVAAAAVVLVAAGPASASTTGRGSVPAPCQPFACPGLAATATSLTFAPRVDGTGFSAPQTITITNTSSEPIDITSPGTGDTDFNFSLAGTTCGEGNGEVAPGGNCVLAVAFDPFSITGTISNIAEATVTPVVGNRTTLVFPVSGVGLAG